MKGLNLITLIIAIVGAINWGLVGAFNFNLVAALFGADSGLTRLVYSLVGLSGLYQLYPFAMACNSNEIVAESNATRAM